MAKPTTRKPTTPKRSPARLTPEQAARHVGLTLDQLMRTRARGLAPGILGDCQPRTVLGFDRAVLEQWITDQQPAPAASEPVDDD